MNPRNKNLDQEKNTPDQQAQENKNVEQAHKQAEHDMEKDVDLNAHHPNDDLDEGESARLGEDKTDLV